MTPIQQKFQKGFNFSIVALGFFIPVSVFLTDLFVFLSLFFWLGTGDLKLKFREMFRNKVMVSVLLFEILYIVGLLWTNNLPLGVKNLTKEIILLIAVVFGTAVISERTRVLAMSSFLISMMISVFLSLLLSLNIIPVINPKIDANLPFMGHIDFTPFLSIAILFLLIYIDKLKKQISPAFLYISIGLMLIDLLITKGRAGQVAFLITFIAYLLFKFKNSVSKFIIGFACLCAFTVAAYFLVKPFKFRVDQAQNEIVTFKKNPDTSVGKRIAFFINSLEVIAKKPIYGHGTGGFDKEYAIVNLKNSPHLPNTINPHNNYIYVLCEFGVIGLLLMINLFYQQIRVSISELKTRKEFGQIKLIFLFTFLIVMFSGCFIFYHNSTVLFAFFTGLMYSNVIKEEEVTVESFNVVLS